MWFSYTVPIIKQYSSKELITPKITFLGPTTKWKPQIIYQKQEFPLGILNLNSKLKRVSQKRKWLNPIQSIRQIKERLSSKTVRSIVLVTDLVTKLICKFGCNLLFLCRQYSLPFVTAWMQSMGRGGGGWLDVGEKKSTAYYRTF